TDFGGKTSIFSHPVYLFLREFSLQDSRGGSSLLGQHVLYEVNDEASRVNILAVVGQRQNPRFIL
ncbi:TPA: hypothetical protein ACHK2A_002525, partial [Escherichia coli]